MPARRNQASCRSQDGASLPPNSTALGVRCVSRGRGCVRNGGHGRRCSGHGSVSRADHCVQHGYIPAWLTFSLDRSGSGPPSWAYVVRDHFCPSVPRSVSRENRLRRISWNRNRSLSSRAIVHRAPFVEPVRSFPKEYVDVLKAAYVERSYYGGPDYVCQHCSAVFWFGERIRGRSSFNQQCVVYNLCCRGGRVSLPPHRPFPPPLRDLVSFNGGSSSNVFMRLIRQYNSLFAFTSLGVHVDKSINTGDGPYVFRINGVVHHRNGSLLPQPGNRPAFAQLYIYDTPNELQNRLNLLSEDGTDRPDPDIVQSLITMLDEYNPLVSKFRLARDRLLSPTAPDISIKLRGAVDSHADRYSLPAVPELAGLIVGGLSTEVNSFDVVVQTHSSVLKQISPVHPALMSLQYPLFPHGDVGYHTGIKLKMIDDDQPGGRETVSMTEFYAFTCIIGRTSLIQCFVRAVLRTETYQGISDVIGKGALSGKDVGVKKMLPASHVGGKRYMQTNYHDCMAICCAYGPPDKFTTMTCNSNWPEIKDALRCEPGQKPCDRADVVVRVFHMKLDEFLQDLKDGHIFGPVCAVAHTNEFQKRGLPHTHVIVWQSQTGREPSITGVDQHISAELPDPATDPLGGCLVWRLRCHSASHLRRGKCGAPWPVLRATKHALGFSLVQEFMMHGPCGASNPNSPCMKDGKCSKRYPKPFQAETSFDADGYPLYRRRDSGIVVWKNGVHLDNQWVVPHNLLILKKYQTHVNVEACNETYLIKYLFTYVNKRFDCAKFGLRKEPSSSGVTGASSQGSSAKQETENEGVDEIAEYIRSRCLSWCEAIWRLLGFEIHGKFPPVERLYVHLPGLHFVSVHEEADLQSVIDDPDSEKSMLTEWFVANQRSTLGHDLTYCEFPSRYTWDADHKVWNCRRQRFKLGRLRYVHPSVGENFYLRMLLMVVRGAKSYEDVRTHEGIVYNTFREACQARGLIGDDTEWVCLFDEAVVWATAYQMRNLFMTVLVYCEIGNVRLLFDKYWRFMAGDIAYRLRNAFGNPSYEIPDSVLQPALLRELSIMFSNNGLSIASYDLPQLTPSVSDAANRLILEEMSYDRTELLAESTRMSAQLNTNQLSIYENVVRSVCHGDSFVYFVSGHGGTGKTFLLNAILSTLRSQDHIVLAVASCGVASLLLPGGQTAHSRYKIPLDVNEISQCAIGRGTNLAALIARASLIIWDEAPMSHKHCFEALDRTLRDILSVDDLTRSSKPFGGKPILLGGDFRQVLPVIPGAGRSEILRASLLGSHIWKHVEVFRLSINMRLTNPSLCPQKKSDMERFVSWVLDIGEGHVEACSSETDLDKNLIMIPEEFLLIPTGLKIHCITERIYDDFLLSYLSIRYLADRSIVCLTNVVVDEINNFMVNRVPGCVREYLSFDQVANSSEQPYNFEALYPKEFLNSISINNFPQHRLALKIGIPVVLLRNINQLIGLCNGTRLIIERLGDRVLEARIMTGNHIGESVGIPRIVLRRRQFPIRVCYAMTISKCQGQTFQKVGIYLREPVFTHGQLYVAVSRVSCRQGLTMLIEDDDGKSTPVTKNIVYEEVLDYV